MKDSFVLTACSYQNPTNVMSLYWLNNTCSPFETHGTCTLGNIAPYAISVDGADAVAAGLRFAKEKNLRITVKNTGHDILGRSAGKGALELWTHHLKDITFLNYNSPGYKGPAVKLGTGVQAFEAYEAASSHGLRVVGGSCPTVGLAAGFVQGGGHGPLGSTYGLGADNTLEFEVVTAEGKHLTATPTQHSDLYWALSGGGAGNYAVVLATTVKAHADGPIAGATLSFLNTDDAAFWAGISAWLKYQVVLNAIPGFSSLWEMTKDIFRITYITLPNGGEADVSSALAPWMDQVKALNLTVDNYVTGENPGFYEHFQQFQTDTYSTNSSQGSRLISAADLANNMTNLVTALRDIVYDETVVGAISGISNNFSHASVGNKPGSNAVLPQWRDALFTINMVGAFEPSISSAELARIQSLVNGWQLRLREITPGSGTYMNEAIYDYHYWKEDYYGSTYEELLAIKKTYDPQHVLWAHAAVGSDDYWIAKEDGRLCRAE